MTNIKYVSVESDTWDVRVLDVRCGIVAGMPWWYVLERPIDENEYLGADGMVHRRVDDGKETNSQDKA